MSQQEIKQVKQVQTAQTGQNNQLNQESLNKKGEQSQDAHAKQQTHNKHEKQDDFVSYPTKQMEEVDVDELKIDEDGLQDQQLQKCDAQSTEMANQLKAKGNEAFKQQKWTQAIISYQKGLTHTSDKSLRATLYSNISICFIKLGDYKMGKKYCNKTLKEDQSHRKGRMNLARCLQQQKKIQQAFQQYKKLQQNLSGASERDAIYIKNKIKQLKPKVDELNQSRKKQVMDGLKNIGNSILGYFGMSLDNFKLEQGANGGYNVSFKQ